MPGVHRLIDHWTLEDIAAGFSGSAGDQPRFRRFGDHRLHALRRAGDFPYQPKMVFLRAGWQRPLGRQSVEQVFADYKEFVGAVHAQLPDAKIVFISLSPSLARWTQRDKEKP